MKPQVRDLLTWGFLVLDRGLLTVLQNDRSVRVRNAAFDTF